MKPNLLFVLLLSGCLSPAATPPDTLVVGLEAAPPGLADPRPPGTGPISGLIFNGLFRRDERFQAVADLADSVDTITPLSYRIRLKKGFSFHDGRPLTAEDVKRTVESVQQDPSLAVLQRIKVVDPITVEITLRQPDAGIWENLCFGILPQGVESGIGTGPYRIEKSSPESILLVRNENYPGIQPKLGRILFRVIPEAPVRAAELLRGRLDLLQDNLPPSLLDTLHRKGLPVATTEGVETVRLVFNLKEGPTARPAVRRAIFQALDLPALIAYGLQGMAEPAHGFLPTAHWAHSPETPSDPFDREKARTLLEEEGYPDPDQAGPQVRFPLKLHLPPGSEESARLIARSLREIGIAVQAIPANCEGDFQLCLVKETAGPLPDGWWGKNRNGYANPIVDRLLEEIRVTADRRKQFELYSLVEKILAQDLPHRVLYYEKRFAVYSPRLKGVRLRPDGGYEPFAEITKP